LSTDAGVLLSARGLSAAAGGRTLFERLDVEVSRGRLVLVVGPNGAGKTTLLRILLGLQAPRAGSVVRAAGTRVGYVPQLDPGDDGLPFPALSVVLQGFPGVVAGRARVRAAVDALARAGFGPPPSRRYDRLSGGERRRVLLARALAPSPDLLALDEPLANLDAAGERDTAERIAHEAHRRGVGVVCVSHATSVLEREADAVVRVGGGA